MTAPRKPNDGRFKPDGPEYDDGFLVKHPPPQKPGATAAAPRPDKETMMVRLRPGDRQRLETGLPDVLELVRDVGAVFAMLSYEGSSGIDDVNAPAVRAIARMAARAIRSMEPELDAIDWLEGEICRAAEKGGAG